MSDNKIHQACQSGSLKPGTVPRVRVINTRTGERWGQAAAAPLRSCLPARGPRAPARCGARGSCCPSAPSITLEAASFGTRPGGFVPGGPGRRCRRRSSGPRFSLADGRGARGGMWLPCAAACAALSGAVRAGLTSGRRGRAPPPPSGAGRPRALQSRSESRLLVIVRFVSATNPRDPCYYLL